MDFTRATDAVGGVIDRWFMIAGRPVVLRFAGPRLLPLAEAFEHLACAPQPALPALTIHLWDRASTGIGAAASARRPNRCGGRSSRAVAAAPARTAAARPGIAQRYR